MKGRRSVPEWRLSRPSGMTVTIARLMARLAADLGREPTDAEVAATLAISPARVQHHRRLIRGLPP